MSTSRSLAAGATLLAVALAGPPTAGAAKYLSPPSQSLLEPQNLVGVVQATTGVEEGRAGFAVEELLFGELDEGIEEITVRVPAEPWIDIEPGERYILGWTELTPLYSPKGTFTPDPEGPRVVRVAPMGAVVLEASDPLRTLLRRRAEGEELSARQRLDALVAQLDRAHPGSQRFAAAELSLARELDGRITEKDAERLAERIVGGELDVMAVDFLLRAARRGVERWGTERVAKAARAVIDASATELDLGSFRPAALETALLTLGDVGAEKDAERLARHLGSNNPAVMKAALASLDRLAPGVADEASRSLLGRDDLPAETRRILERHLPRPEPAGEASPAGDAAGEADAEETAADEGESAAGD